MIRRLSADLKTANEMICGQAARIDALTAEISEEKGRQHAIKAHYLGQLKLIGNRVAGPESKENAKAENKTIDALRRDLAGKDVEITRLRKLTDAQRELLEMQMQILSQNFPPIPPLAGA